MARRCTPNSSSSPSSPLPSSTPSSSSRIPFWLEMLLRCSPLVALLGLVVSAGYYPYSVGAPTPAPNSSPVPLQAIDGITNTKFTGACADSVCYWYGIRYAAPPLDELRFAPPQTALSPGANYSAIQMGPRCPQAATSTEGQDEDCLFLNIQRPQTVPLSTKLPVLVFFHGGGFETGSGNDNDPKAVVQIGQQHNQPVMIVRISYRLALFGFLGGSDIGNAAQRNATNAGLNLGFRDMKLATQWVQQHITYFGGDPTKLTIWGQSAGSFGASAQLLAYANEAPPFQAAILESGSAGGVPIDPPSAKDAQYERVLASANCNLSNDQLACLRAVPWQTLRMISIAESTRAMQPATYARGYYAWTPVMDGGPSQGGFYSSRPSQLINNGSFARVPVLHGDCLDEGTYFAPQTFDDSTSFAKWITSVYLGNPASSMIATTNALEMVLLAYPDVPSLGSPYMPVGASADNRFYGTTNQYKRAASVYGDIRYQSNRRFFLSALAAHNVTAYSYLYAQEQAGIAPSLGVPHGSDLSALLQSPSNPISVTYARQYLAFATSHDPSASSGLPEWPSYTTLSPSMLQFRDNAITTILDDYRASAIQLLNGANIQSLTGR